MAELVAPHGSDRLKPRLIPEVDRSAALAAAEALPRLPMSSRETSDVLMLAMGAYTPLAGFMGRADWHRVCAEMRLASGVFWPIPITLSVDRQVADDLANGAEVALFDEESGEILATMTVAERYEIDRGFEARAVFGTTDPAHPGVEKLMTQKDINLAGPVRVLSEGGFPGRFPGLYVRPEEARARFLANGWSRVTAFQTRNPMHRSHEHLVKIALEVTDGVFVHQVLGKLKPGDIPAEVRTEAIQKLIDGYFVQNTVMQAGYPIEMRYAGPREALFHALIRQNYGCSHLVVGRDHAGVGDYYPPTAAQEIFDTLWDGALETQPLKISNTFYCGACFGMATERTCPHDASERVNISGTEMRRRLAAGEDVPPEFSRPEVVKILQAYYAGLNAA